MAVAVPSREEGAVVPSPLMAVEAAALRADDVLARLGSGAPGLPEDEAARRLRVVGPNAVRSHRVHALSVLASQLRSPLLILLAVTALASAFLGQVSDAVIIGVILAASVGLGFVNVLCPAALCARGGDDQPGSRRDGQARARAVHITLAAGEAAFLQLTRREEVAMLEEYFVKPDTVDRIRSSWVGPEVERYVAWLAGQGYRPRTVWHRVPLLLGFAEFARDRGARTAEDLPAHVEAFVADCVARREACRRGGPVRQEPSKEFRGPVEQMLELVVPGYQASGRRHHDMPFSGSVPGFFEYLSDERGLRPASILRYQHYLDRFEAYLARIGVRELAELSPAVLSAFIAERSGAGLAKTTVGGTCGALRVFLRYAHRQGHIRADLSAAVEWPQIYRLSDIPRSISWAQVGQVVDGVDRRTPAGKRDYATLLLLVTYGLRAREVAALTLDDIDWRRERLAVPERKAGHSTAFPLAVSVGTALAIEAVFPSRLPPES